MPNLVFKLSLQFSCGTCEIVVTSRLPVYKCQSQPHISVHRQGYKIEFSLQLFGYLVDLGDNGEPIGLISLGTFWNDNVLYDECCYLLADLHRFTLDFLAPVAAHGHSTSSNKKKYWGSAKPHAPNLGTPVKMLECNFFHAR